MGELLLNWLNDQIQLSKRITNFQEDFHNGFLFGELLAKYSQQLNFHEFIDKDDKASRVKNFSLLLQTLTALRVTYDSNTAFKIINRQLGVAKKLLYELKTQLQKTNDNAFSKTNKLSKTLTPLKKIQISKDKFDQVQKEHFVKQLNELHPAQKEIIEHQLLRKFNDFQLNSTLRAAQDEEKELQSKLLLRNKFYEQERDNLKKSQEFRKQWQAQNRQKWANNMTIRQIQINKDTEFKQREQDIKLKSKINSEASALKALESDIAEFERKNLKSRKGPQIESDEEEPVKELRNTKTKEKPILEVREEKRLPNGQNQKKKHQREKRRRKMIVEQMKKYQLIEINRRERCIISTIEQTSKQEKEIQYEIWRAWQNKSIIIQNKNVQLQKIKEKEQTRAINAKFKKDQLLKTYREEHRKEVDQALTKMTQLERVNQAKSRKAIYSQCQKMVCQLLEITEKMYVSAQERNSKHIDEQQLQAQFVKFVEGTPDEEESSLRLKHYIQGSHQWNIPITRPQEEVSTNPKDDNALPNETVNNYYLGNILKTIFQKYYQNDGNSQVQVKSDRLVIALLGLQFARKHEIASTLAEKYQFQVIEVQKLIQQKLNDWLQFQRKGIQVSKETSHIAAQCFSGRQLEDETIVQLVSQSVQKSSKAIILDFPNTQKQAIELCRLISGVQPHDLLQKDKLQSKIDEFSKLVKPTNPKIIERQIKGCGIDFVWWINVTPQNSFDRMLGRRWINNQMVNIYDQVDPGNLKEGEKASALAMRNHFKLKNKSGLESWFNLFGVKVEEGNKNCWLSIQGNTDSSTLQSSILQKINESMKIKEETKARALKEQEEKKKNLEQMQKKQKQKQAIKQKCCKANPEVLKQELTLALNKVDIDAQFITQTAEVWNRIESTTINSLKKVFHSLSQQQKSKRSYLAQLKRNFIGLLTRADHKFHLIKDFQINYNHFLTQNQDMLAFEYTKQELHQRVQDLQNDLLALVQEKKQDAISERNSIISSGWLEAQIDLIYQCLYLLAQTQLNRFAASQKIIVDFYAKKFMCNTKTFEPLAPQINSETYTSLQGYKDSACPKLDKIISQAIRILNREQEVVDDKNKKGGKGAPPKKQQKKAAKKGGKQQVQQIKEPTPEEVELKAAVNTQKAILRQRLNRIKTLGYKIISETFASAHKLYAELEDLYVYTHKVEQKAIFGLSKIFKRAIEKEQKIQSEVQIKHVEIVETELIRNFQKQKPTILPAKERASDNHFTISNLQQIYKLVSNEAEGSKISTKRLTVLLSKLISSESLKKLTPKSWKSLKISNIEGFVKMLDRSNIAYVNLSELFMFFALIGYCVPNAAQMEEYTLNLSNYSSLKEVNEQKFLQTKCWFDQQIVIEQNVRVFNRNKEIKRVLFSIFKNEDDSLQISNYLSAINLQSIGKAKQVKREGETYFDVAFI